MLKTISSITNALGALNYKGTWNALTNSPTLADGTGSKGDYYVTSTAGTQTFGGLLLFFGIGDWIAYNGAVWQRVEGGSDGNFANITLNSTDAGATEAPLLDLYRDSASPAASDTLGEIIFNGEDSAGNKQKYGCIHGSIISPTSGAEGGQLHFETTTAGASTEKMIIGTSNLVINDIGAVYNVRIEGDTDANLFYTDATNSRVGIGTISPATKLDVSGTITATSIIDSALTSGRVTYAGTSGVLQDSANLNFDGTNLCVGSPTVNNAGVISLDFNGQTQQGITLDDTSASNGGYYVFFRNNTGATAGYIEHFSSTVVAYMTTSDYRLKEDVQPMTGALAKVTQLKPVTYKWKADGLAGQGFIAHELKAIVPDCVSGEKDATYEDGSIKPQGIDTSFLVATLTAAIQEQQALIESLTTRLTALENK
jgi:hypothetical protein